MRVKTIVLIPVLAVAVFLASLLRPSPHAWGPPDNEGSGAPQSASEPPPIGELTWVKTGGPPGGLGYDIRYNFADPNTWYVTDNFAGVHISTDNGRTWAPSNSGIPGQAGATGDWRPIFCLTVDPHNPQIIWAGTDGTGHIYRSTDGGLTWQQRDQGVVIEHDLLSFRGFTVDPVSSDIVYAMGETSDLAMGGPLIWSNGVGGVVYKTADAGAHWEKLWDGGMPSSLARYMWINPRNLGNPSDDILYVSTGIYDRGAVGEGDPETDIDPFGGLGILRSSDCGQTWEVLGKANGLEMLYLGSLYMDPRDPDVLLAAAGHEMRLPQIQHLRQIGHSPAGVYRTTDGGDHWVHVLEPQLPRVQEEFSSVELCPSNPDIAYASSADGIYRSEDNGQTWVQVAGQQGPWGPPGVRAGWPIDLQCDPRDPNRIFANNYQGGNFLSEDGGYTWRNASDGYTGAQVYSVAADPTNPARAYAEGRSGIWRTDDGGRTWSGLRYLPPNAPAPGAEWGTVGLDPSRPPHLVTGDIDGPYVVQSQDGGRSWEYQRFPQGAAYTVVSVAFAPSDPNTIYLGLADVGCVRNAPTCESGSGVLRSTDAGLSWERAADAGIQDVPVTDLAVDPTDAQVVYATADWHGLFKTIDGGASWAPVSIDNAPEGSRLRSVVVHPGDPQRVLVGILEFGIFASLDGGQSWQPAYAGLEPNGAIVDIVFDPIESTVAYAADRLGGVYRSTDTGLNWTKINAGLDNRSATSLALSADGLHVYAATDGAGVYRLDVNGELPVVEYIAYLPVVSRPVSSGG